MRATCLPALDEGGGTALSDPLRLRRIPGRHPTGHHPTVSGGEVDVPGGHRGEANAGLLDELDDVLELSGTAGEAARRVVDDSVDLPGPDSGHEGVVGRSTLPAPRGR